MIESMFVFLLAISFVIFILHYFVRDHILGFLSMALWTLVLINSIYIWVPNDTYYSDWVFNTFPLAFIFTSLIIIILTYIKEQQEREVIP